MEIQIGGILEFVVTSGLYIVIISRVFKLITKTKRDDSKEKQGKEYAYNDSPNNNSKMTLNTRKTNGNVRKTMIDDKSMKKKSVFTSMMQQVDKISDSFENMEKNWNKNSQSKIMNEKSNIRKAPEKILNKASTDLATEKDPNSEIYETKKQDKIYGMDEPTGMRIKRQELKRAIIMKEILDKPLAYRQIRR